MKEDVLEQVVDDYLRSLGFLTLANVRYRPSPMEAAAAGQSGSGFSDVDVIGYSPTRYGADRVWVVSCKSWQVGLDPGKRLDQLRDGKQIDVHREVWVPVWGKALCDEVERLTGQRAFRFFTAVTRLKGDVTRWSEWQDEPQILESLEGNAVGFLRLEDLWRRTVETSTSTLASSVMGRLAQVLVAAGQATPVATEPGSVNRGLTHPHDVEPGDLPPSLSGMWVPPPPVSGPQGINVYAHSLQGYEYAGRHYGVEPTHEGLVQLLEGAAPLPQRSFELLRLEQYCQVRQWYDTGCPPEQVGDAMLLHGEVMRAWADRRFDRNDVPGQPHLAIEEYIDTSVIETAAAKTLACSEPAERPTTTADVPTSSSQVPCWHGVVGPAEAVPAAVHQLMTMAYAGDWERVLRLIEDDSTRAVTPNRWRPDSEAMYTPLHQAAWHGAPLDVVQRLVELGAWRRLRTTEGLRAVDIARQRGATHLLEALEPTLVKPLDDELIGRLDQRLAEVIESRTAQLPVRLRHPTVEVLTEMRTGKMWYPVPGMYGGFSIELRENHLYVESWCRIVGGSGQAHVITADRSTLVNEGFV